MSLNTKDQLNMVIKAFKKLLSFKADKKDLATKIDRSEFEEEVSKHFATKEYVNESISNIDFSAEELITIDDIDAICGAEAFTYDELGNVSLLSLYNNSTVTYDVDGNVSILSAYNNNTVTYDIDGNVTIS